MPQKLKEDGLKYIVAKLETVHTALNESIYFTSDADLKREILDLANRISQIIDKLTPKPPPRFPPTTDEGVYQRWLETQQ
jgi:hypothetical protein